MRAAATPARRAKAPAGVKFAPAAVETEVEEEEDGEAEETVEDGAAEDGAADEEDGAAE